MMTNRIKTSLLICCFLFAVCLHLSAAKSKTSVDIVTDPPQAQIFIDGELVGKSPCAVDNIQPGEHLLSATLDGFYEVRRTFTLTRGEIARISLRLEPITGLLLLHSEPDGANVEINGNFIGTTPLFLSDVTLGKKEISFSKAGYVTKKVEIILNDRTPKKVAVQLMGNYGALNINSTPRGASIILNSSIIKKTPALLEKVATGEHKIELKLDGAEKCEQSVSVNAGDTLNIDAHLTMLPARLKIYSVPAGAKILVNKRIVGTSSVEQVKVKAGEVEIGAELKGYDVAYKTLNVRHGEEVSVELKLEKSSGTVLIATEPPGASVFLDGELCGITSELGDKPISQQMRIEAVSQGEHKILITRSGYYDKTIDFKIAPKETLTFSEKLVPRPVAFVPNTIVRVGEGDAYSTYRGVKLKEKYPNGDIKMEISPGIYKIFRLKDILSMETITNRFEPSR